MRLQKKKTIKKQTQKKKIQFQFDKLQIKILKIWNTFCKQCLIVEKIFAKKKCDITIKLPDDNEFGGKQFPFPPYILFLWKRVI